MDEIGTTPLRDSLQAAAQTVREINTANGWYAEVRDFSADIALLHSEVSEAFEGFRDHDMDNVSEEMADIFIRLLDTCDRWGVNLAAEFEKKCQKNLARGYRHGGKAV